MVTLVVLQVDFGPMAKHEANAKKGDLFTTGDRPYAEAKQDVIKGKGKVIDLVFPILVLIISCIIGMIYTGGFLTEQALSMRLQAAMRQPVSCLEASLH